MGLDTLKQCLRETSDFEYFKEVDLFDDAELCQLANDYIDEIAFDEALNIRQRMQRSRLMKRLSKKIARSRKRKEKRKKNIEELKKKAQREARKAFIKKILKGRNPNDLSPAERERVEKMADRKKNMILKKAKKLLKDMIRQEAERIKKVRGGGEEE